MALDTTEKRRAVLGVGRPYMRGKLPVATPDTEWRAASGNAYAPYGLAAEVAIWTEQTVGSASWTEQVPGAATWTEQTV